MPISPGTRLGPYESSEDVDVADAVVNDPFRGAVQQNHPDGRVGNHQAGGAVLPSGRKTWVDP